MVPRDGGAGLWRPDDVRGQPTGSPDGEAEGQAEVQDGPTPARQEMGAGEGMPQAGSIDRSHSGEDIRIGNPCHLAVILECAVESAIEPAVESAVELGARR